MKILLLCLLLVTASSFTEAAEKMNICETGKMQSPINIDTSTVKRLSHAEKIISFYKPVFFKFTIEDGSFKAKPLIDGNVLIRNGKPYPLQEFHFHHKSEHTINGQPFPMELHIVHKSKDGKQMVVGVLIEEGTENKEFKELLSSLKTIQKGQSKSLQAPINLNELFSSETDVYRYVGSFTTPPCTEPVLWLIKKEPITLSWEQIQAFQHLVGTNNRSIQPLNEREISLTKIQQSSSK
ncbi:carbonic anhydrase [Metabacillus iocasae]|uniref:Carbonic anhydrase n=1 Tax=Priestia iocasae TaxID=2291674 RepID=A0ABS2QWT2_9BACI|nr:carbonic anhydrase family protein [Metabacillus iocasae]MBM7703933.1 carbonic anhydrase [Metabacillus iocasae]